MGKAEKREKGKDERKEMRVSIKSNKKQRTKRKSVKIELREHERLYRN